MDLKRRVVRWAPFIILALAAVILRLYAIDRLPPGLFGDEAVEGLDALDVLAGNLAIWFHAHLGREPIYVYLVALSYWAFGVTPLATRLPALVAGLLTVPATFFLVREWAAGAGIARPVRLALLTTGLLAISFWHIQMTRDAHRDTLLPLVEATGYGLLWMGVRKRSWKAYAAAGAVLGLAIYTYSPGRFVGVFVLIFIAVELVVSRIRPIEDALSLNWRGLLVAGAMAVLVMLPLGVYFLQNPVQFSRRFESVSVFDADAPPAALASSVTGNLAQFVVPDAGYQSKHYNLPGKPIFDLFIAPWFLLGVVIAGTRWRRPAYRFLLLWFAVMMVPAFVTADMIPKAVRSLGVVPGVLFFPALAMDWLLERMGSRARGDDNADLANSTVTLRQRGAVALIGICFVGSAAWTTYDYFVAWANMPDLPLAFDADMMEVSDYILKQPSDRRIYISSEVYRPPTEMLLGRRVPTSRYVDRATRISEFDGRSTLVAGPQDANAAYIWVRDNRPPDAWLGRLAPRARVEQDGMYATVLVLNDLAAPQRPLDAAVGPLLTLVGYSVFRDEPSGLALFWRVTALPSDRQDIQATVSLGGPTGAGTQSKHTFGVPPLDWTVGDTFVEWYTAAVPDALANVKIQLARGPSIWEYAFTTNN